MLPNCHRFSYYLSFKKSTKPAAYTQDGSKSKTRNIKRETTKDIKKGFKKKTNRYSKIFPMATNKRYHNQGHQNAEKKNHKNNFNYEMENNCHAILL